MGRGQGVASVKISYDEQEVWKWLRGDWGVIGVGKEASRGRVQGKAVALGIGHRKDWEMTNWRWVGGWVAGYHTMVSGHLGCSVKEGDDGGDSGARMLNCGFAGLWDAQGYWELWVGRVSGEWSGLLGVRGEG